jgi:hypothetical protein
MWDEVARRNRDLFEPGKCVTIIKKKMLDPLYFTKEYRNVLFIYVYTHINIYIPILYLIIPVICNFLLLVTYTWHDDDSDNKLSSRKLA